MDRVLNHQETAHAPKALEQPATADLQALVTYQALGRVNTHAGFPLQHAPQHFLQLQRTIGNRAVQRLLQQTPARMHGPTHSLHTNNQAALIQAQTQPESASATGSTSDTGPTALIEKAAAIIGGGQVKFYYLAADQEGNALFVIFDNPDVQAFYRHLLKEWFGVAEPNAALENTPNVSAPPKWVDAIRAKALNAEPQSSPQAKQLSDLALKLVNSVAAETPVQRLRRQFVEEADKRIGTTVMTQAQINAERAKPASAGLTPQNFTTCIAFFGQVVQQVTRQSKLKGSLLQGPNAYHEINPAAKGHLPAGAWHPCTPGGTDRPKPGDLLIFTFAEAVKSASGALKFNKGWFAHITIFRSIQPLQDTEEDKKANGLTAQCSGSMLEKWISIDGGGTTAKEVIRYFCPEKCLIAGRTDKRTLHGWIDIEKVAEDKLGKEA